MITLEETLNVKKPVHDVFRYVADFSHIREWDPAVLESRKTTPGKPGAGTAFALKLRYGPFPVSMTYVIREFAPPCRVVLEGRGESFTAVDTILFEPGDGGTRIRYRADLDFRGAGARIAPLFRRALAGAGKRAMEGLGRAFDRQPAVPTRRGADTLLLRSVIGGLPSFTRFGYGRARKRFEALTESLEGRTAVVTGATSGIGFAAALGLARLGARVVLVARDRDKAETALTLIAGETGNTNLAVHLADLGILSRVRGAAEAILAAEGPVHILVNNAGALFTSRQETAEGFERTFATDLLAPFALTEFLLPRLAESAPARIVNVSSGGMYTQPLVPEDLQFTKEPYNGPKAYARAKRGLVVLTGMWAERFGDKGVTVHAMHPGWVGTPGLRTSLPGFTRLTAPLLRTPEQGADTIVWLAAAPEAALVNGLFWLDRRPRAAHVFSSTRESQEQREVLYRALSAIVRKATP